MGAIRNLPRPQNTGADSNAGVRTMPMWRQIECGLSHLSPHQCSAVVIDFEFLRNLGFLVYFFQKIVEIKISEVYVTDSL